jgi:hypothetical protein
MEEVLQQFSSHLQAVALLDRDTAVGSGDALIELLPVSMIESFLLDPDSMWEALQSVLEKTTFRTVDDVGNALGEIISGLTVAEVGRRIALGLGSSHFFPPSTACEIHQAGLPKVVFTFLAAQNARRRRAVVSFFDAFFARLTQSLLPATTAPASSKSEVAP